MSQPGMVSVVIPTFNYGLYIGAAIDSILCQSRCDVEVIVVDDGSEDDTRQILDKYLVDDRVRYLRQPRAGASAARNCGILAARGEYLAFLDADDLWPQRDMLATGTEYLSKNPSVGWLFGDAQPFNKDGVADKPYLLKGRYYEDGATQLEVRPLTPADLCNDDKFFIPTGTVIVRKSCFDAVGLFDTSLKMFEDTDMWLRLLRFPVAFLPQVLLARRLHDTNVSNFRWAYLDDLKKLIDRYHLEEHGVSFSFHAARGNYLAGRHWIGCRDYGKARSAFRDALRFQLGWRPAVFLAFATLAQSCRKVTSPFNNGAAKDFDK